MVGPGGENRTLSGRPRVLRSLPRPTDEFRKKSWLAFQAALDRHLGRRRRRRRRREPSQRLFSP